MTAQTPVRTVVRGEVARATRLLVDTPRPLLSAGFAGLSRLPPRSRLRRRSLTALLLTGFDLLNRREIDRLLRFYDPACEIRLGPGWPLDLDPVQHGWAGARAIIEAWDETGEVTSLPEELLDAGGPAFVVLASVRMTGAASGANPAPLRAVWRFAISRGLVVRQAMRNDGWNRGPGGARRGTYGGDWL